MSTALVPSTVMLFEIEKPITFSIVSVHPWIIIPPEAPDGIVELLHVVFEVTVTCP
jgi:hypothetical protein